MSTFKWRRFAGEVMSRAVRRCCSCGTSYRGHQGMLGERGVEAGHNTTLQKL